MKISQKRDMERFVSRIRNGHQPKPVAGKHDDKFYDPELKGFGIRITHTGVPVGSLTTASTQQKKKTLGDVRVLDRDVALKAAKDELARVQLGKHVSREERLKAQRAEQTTFKSAVPGFLEHEKHKVNKKRKQKLRSRTVTAILNI